MAAGAAALLLATVAPPAFASQTSLPTTDAEDTALAFAADDYTTITVSVDGAPLDVRWYKEVCYVAAPIAVDTPQPNKQCGYQSMNVFVPENAADSQDSAIYLSVSNSGWNASYIRASVTDGASYDSATSNVGAALKEGFVFVNAAGRSRGIADPDGNWVGKAPAAVVDAKAAVRYLRLNDSVMPGSAERIVANGTSGGGALVSALGAAGNSPDYYPYLEEIGAAGIDAAGRSTQRDDILVVNAYCPITDLGNADIMYEWLYNVLDTRETLGENPNPAASAELAAAFAEYQASLGLTNRDGTPVSADTMIDAVKTEVIRSAEAYMAASDANVIPDLGENIVITGSGAGIYLNDWIDVDNATNTVAALDVKNYLAFVAKQSRLKPAPSFDQSAVTAPGSGGGPGTGESSLFGTSAQVYSNFTEYSWNHNTVRGDGSGADDSGKNWDQFMADPATIVDEQLDLVNPMHFLGDAAPADADAAPYWYVRHGTRDRDTSFTVSINLDRALASDSDVKDVNYRLAWNQPHAGNYDVPEAMAWIKRVLAEADAHDADGIELEATVPAEAAGSLALTIADYGDKVTLAKADNGGDRIRFTGALPAVTVTDSRNPTQAGRGGWSVSGQASEFTSKAQKLGAEHLGWTPKVLTERDGVSAGDRVATSLDRGPGLAAPATLASANTQGRFGSATATAGLTLDVPVDTAPGTYRGTITVSLFPVD